jgi:parallel beta-helix repeat protein
MSGTGDGLEFFAVTDSQISNNACSNNSVGIRVDNTSSHNLIAGNLTDGDGIIPGTGDNSFADNVD